MKSKMLMKSWEPQEKTERWIRRKQTNNDGKKEKEK